jgi:3-hydroxyisobutyrate dehydrogenase
MGARAAELYERFAAAGQGGLDFSGIIRMLRGETA